MRVPLAWLAEFVDLPDADSLVERLTLAAFEDVLIDTPGPDLSAIRVGRVQERAAHPNADRLSVCRVDLGEGEPIEVVCGAPNVAAGQKVAVALPGTRLPDGTQLKRSKIRGVVSGGMICSRSELGLGDEHEGILVLDPEAPVGAPLPAALADDERVLEFGITPNRGDAASLLGVAREVRALFGGTLRLPETAPPESGAPCADAVTVAIEAPEACYRYAARLVRGVRVAPSPDVLARRLEACGIRPINNVVDVTNQVLLEFGQPLHAFDFSRVAGGRVRVRRATPGETLVTLDGQRRGLDAEDLVIADAERAIALAGVMGGAETEVGDETVDVLIESAHFEPTGVRRSARRHGIHSEASYRFERGVDRLGVERAADRAARLIAEFAGGEVAPGAVVECGEAAPFTEEIALPVERANRLLGTQLPVREVCALLERVGVRCREEPAGVVRGRVPSHRNDLHVHQDLTEEVARVHGYERIPTTLPTGELGFGGEPPLWSLGERARDALCGAGLAEVVSLPFLAEADLAPLRLESGDPRRVPLRVANPLQDEHSGLRTTLLPALLRLVRQNLGRGVERVRVFELGRCFIPQGEGALPLEPLAVAAALAHSEGRELWQNAPPIFFEAKGIAERLLSQLGYVASLRRGAVPEYLHPGAAAVLMVGGQEVGAVGELHPDVAGAFTIDVPCAVLEVALGALEALPRRELQVRPVSRQPAVRRDLAVVLDREQPAGEVLEAIRKAAGADLLSAEVFDRYEGSGVPEGRVSLAFRLVFQRADRTLVDAEVSRATDRVVKMLSHRFGGELR